MLVSVDKCLDQMKISLARSRESFEQWLDFLIVSSFSLRRSVVIETGMFVSVDKF